MALMEEHSQVEVSRVLSPARPDRARIATGNRRTEHRTQPGESLKITYVRLCAEIAHNFVAETVHLAQT
jgi:hypothetical protein